MTRDPARGRGARSFERSLPFSAGTLLLAVIVGGLLLRAFIAAVWVPKSGFGVDIGDFTAWAQQMATIGPGAFYRAGFLSDYPPGYMYVLWALGSIGHALQPVLGVNITGGLVKIPGVLADAGTAWLLFLFARRFLGDRFGGQMATRIGVAAATVYLFNPGVIFDSSVWGQVDSVGAFAIIGTLYMLARGWTEAASVGAVLCLLLKYQFAFMIPIVAIVGLKRHLFGRSSDPEIDGRPDALRVLTSVAAGLGSLVVLIFPYGLSIVGPSDPSTSLIGQFIKAAGTYTGLSINAFNMWMNPWSGLAAPRDAGGLTPSLWWGDDQQVAFVIGSFSVNWQLVGAILFVAAALFAAWLLLRRDDATGLLVAALVVAVAFFVLPTRVHERYLFPALALGAPLVLRDRRWAILYGLLSISFFANVYGVYTADWSFYQSVINPGVGGKAMVRDPILQATLLSPWGIYLLSAAVVAALGWLLVMAAEVAGETSQRRRQATTNWGAPPQAAAPAFGIERPAWLRRPSVSHNGFFDERRRLDRFDLVLVLAFVLIAFGYRLWRLDEPRSMHFDEVYHARSATEWLADWQHGWKRDVYEWTHPMLAKYLIAAGIEIADPNKAVSSVDLARASPAVAVAPRRDANGYSRSVAFVADGSRIDAIDALNGSAVAGWDAGAPVQSLGFDDQADQLLVGLATSGKVSVYVLKDFLTGHGERAPPALASTIDTGLASVEQIVIPTDGQVTVFRGSDGVTVVERTTGVQLASKQIVTQQIAFATGSADAQGDTVFATLPGQRVVVSLNASTLVERTRQELSYDIPGPLLVQGTGADQQLWVATGPLTATEEHGPSPGGFIVFSAPGLGQTTSDPVPLPGRATSLAWQPIANIVYAAGTADDGSPTLWTIDPLGDSRSGYATFDATTLPAPATAMAFDISDHSQADDNGRLLVATSGGGKASLVGVDAGSNAFSWRLMGIVFGAILVGLIYLLAATMFRRRGIAILAAAFVAFDGMSYVMSRIGMNDIYVAVFIVAAYLVFWQIWSGRWARSAWWALPLVGVLIGLAAATKWVGWYALAGLLVLVLARSALGRFLLVAAIGFLTIVTGFGAPWPFLLACVLALAIAIAFVYVRPVALDPADLMAVPATGVVLGGVGLAFAIGYGQVEGRIPSNAVEALFDFLARGTQAAWPAWLMLAVAGLLIGARAFVSLRDPASDRRWMQPGELAGFAWPWMGACLVVIPLVVYFVAYIPYLQLGHSASIPGGPGYSWSLDELQVQMFSYHFNLQAGHPAASPWWSWPLDLKPVWFYGSPSWDGNVLAAIYNGGNPVLFWAGIPAIVACGVLAWRRRSAALVLIVAAFAFQYLPWTRIERATFQYHYLTAVIFALVAISYLVDEALRNRAYQALAVAFLIAAAVVGVMIWPLGAAWPMPDWYMNAARALPPWNFEFKFPGPPQGQRELFNTTTLKLVTGVVLAVGAAAFALYGRPWVERLGLLPALVGGAPQGSDEQYETDEDQGQRPDLRGPEPGQVVARQEPDPDQDEHGTDEDSALT
jgi:predicted membrane-bound dolichyl-phosphate-mannose-protein mannosyltransferase/Gpi18-like mannosyltransferase